MLRSRRMRGGTHVCPPVSHYSVRFWWCLQQRHPSKPASQIHDAVVAKQGSGAHSVRNPSNSADNLPTPPSRPKLPKRRWEELEKRNATWNERTQKREEAGVENKEEPKLDAIRFCVGNARIEDEDSQKRRFEREGRDEKEDADAQRKHADQRARGTTKSSLPAILDRSQKSSAATTMIMLKVGKRTHWLSACVLLWFYGRKEEAKCIVLFQNSLLVILSCFVRGSGNRRQEDKKRSWEQKRGIQKGL